MLQPTGSTGGGKGCLRSSFFLALHLVFFFPVRHLAVFRTICGEGGGVGAKTRPDTGQRKININQDTQEGTACNDGKKRVQRQRRDVIQNRQTRQGTYSSMNVQAKGAKLAYFQPWQAKKQ